ncbi:MAG: efflux RND transporter periplasmic adaptor subunit [Candidatus Zhuqueibacterota bacterium]
MKRLVVIIGLIGLVAMLSMGCSKSGTSAKDAEVKIPVQTAEVISSTVTKELTYTGDIMAEQEVKLFSKIPDRITRFFKDEGDYVAKGDTIALIQATTIEQAVNQAKAGLASARAQLANLEAEYHRAQRLQKENAISQQQFEAIRTQYEATQALVEQTEAALAQAESQLSDAAITSPISGIIGVRNYDQGDMAAGQFPLATVVKMNRVKVEVDVPEQDLGELKVGQCASLLVRSFPDDKFTGVIDKIRPVLDPMTRMGKIEIMVDNSNLQLKPGMFAEVSICVKTFKNVLVVPKHAIIEKTEMKRVQGEDVAVIYSQVFIEKEGIALLRSVDISYSNGTFAVVTNGVQLGDKIIVVGQQSVKDGSLVNVLVEGGK